MPNRIYNQYNKPNAIAWYNIVPTVISGLQDAHEHIRYSYDFTSPTATSYDLDTVGQIVGVSRSFEQFTTADGTQFGRSTSQWGGTTSQFISSIGNINQQLSNEIYRLLIKAKIARNNSDATIDSISTTLRYITGQDVVRVVDNEDMTFTVEFESELSITERIVLTKFDIIPRPQGVQFLGFLEGDSLMQFGSEYPFGDSRAEFGTLTT